MGQAHHAARRLDALSTGMYLVGGTYNFCFPHQELSKPKHMGFACTPAMAAGLTDHVWSIAELLSYRVAPPPLGCSQTERPTSHATQTLFLHYQEAAPSSVKGGLMLIPG